MTAETIGTLILLVSLVLIQLVIVYVAYRKPKYKEWTVYKIVYHWFNS